MPMKKLTPSEMAEKLRLVQSLIEELLPAAQDLRQRSGFLAEKRERAVAACRKYSDDDKERWRQLAAQPDLSMHSKRRASALIAMREGLPPAAADTIRRAI